MVWTIWDLQPKIALINFFFVHNILLNCFICPELKLKIDFAGWIRENISHVLFRQFQLIAAMFPCQTIFQIHFLAIESVCSYIYFWTFLISLKSFHSSVSCTVNGRNSSQILPWFLWESCLLVAFKLEDCTLRMRGFVANQDVFETKRRVQKNVRIVCIIVFHLKQKITELDRHSFQITIFHLIEIGRWFWPLIPKVKTYERTIIVINF